MSDLVQEKLRGVIVDHGRRVIDDPLRLEALLRDHCGDYRREVSALLTALKEGIPYGLERLPPNVPRQAALANLAQRLQVNQGLAEDVARWAVEAWAFGLGHTGQIALEAGQSPKQLHDGIQRHAPPRKTREMPSSVRVERSIGSEAATEAEALQKANKRIRNAWVTAVLHAALSLFWAVTLLYSREGSFAIAAGIFFLVYTIVFSFVTWGFRRKNQGAGVLALFLTSLQIVMSIVVLIILLSEIHFSIGHITPGSMIALILFLLLPVSFLYPYFRGVQAAGVYHSHIKQRLPSKEIPARVT